MNVYACTRENALQFVTFKNFIEEMVGTVPFSNYLDTQFVLPSLKNEGVGKCIVKYKLTTVLYQEHACTTFSDESLNRVEERIRTFLQCLIFALKFTKDNASKEELGIRTVATELNVRKARKALLQKYPDAFIETMQYQEISKNMYLFANMLPFFDVNPPLFIVEMNNDGTILNTYLKDTYTAWYGAYTENDWREIMAGNIPMREVRRKNLPDFELK